MYLRSLLILNFWCKISTNAVTHYSFIKPGVSCIIYISLQWSCCMSAPLRSPLHQAETCRAVAQKSRPCTWASSVGPSSSPKLCILVSLWVLHAWGPRILRPVFPPSLTPLETCFCWTEGFIISFILANGAERPGGCVWVQMTELMKHMKHQPSSLLLNRQCCLFACPCGLSELTGGSTLFRGCPTAILSLFPASARGKASAELHMITLRIKKGERNEERAGCLM